jgi:hypothetical protein
VGNLQDQVSDRIETGKFDFFLQRYAPLGEVCSPGRAGESPAFENR